MLEIKNLKKKYGKFQALDGLDLEIAPGELFGFVGPNGAGKTTTIKILAGLLKPDAGQITIAGFDAMKRPEALKECIGYVPDFFGVYDNLKVSEYMEFFASCYGLNGLKARNIYMELLDMVGLGGKEDAFVDGLSRGMKQRLCLARALIHSPKLLILDEPAAGLDPRTRFEFKELLKELREMGMTIIISSHILSELSETCTDIGIIEQGRMVLKGTMADIVSRVNANNPLVIHVYENMEAAVSILRSHPFVRTISVKADSIMVSFSGDKRDEALLLQQLIDAEVLVTSFMREQGNLESLFMQITGNDGKKEVIAHEN